MSLQMDCIQDSRNSFACVLGGLGMCEGVGGGILNQWLTNKCMDINSAASLIPVGDNSEV